MAENETAAGGRPIQSTIDLALHFATETKSALASIANRRQLLSMRNDVCCMRTSMPRGLNFNYSD